MEIQKITYTSQYIVQKENKSEGINTTLHQYYYITKIVIMRRQWYWVKGIKIDE